MRIIFFLSFLLPSLLSSQDKCDLRFSIPDYTEDYIIMGNYFGSQTLIFDTLQMSPDNDYRYSADSLISQGLYILVLQPDNKFVQFAMPEDQEFSITIDTSDLSTLVFEGSEDNQLLAEYTNFLAEQTEKLRVIDNSLADTLLPIGLKNKLESERQFVDVDVKSRQEEILRKHPSTITSAIIKATQQVETPLFLGTEQEQQMQEYYYYRKHYFDHVNLKDPRLLRTNFLFNRIEYYMNKMVYQNPDSLIVAVDDLLAKMEEGSETYRYYLSHFLSKYGNSKMVGMDAIYVHLAIEYYGSGKTPWVEEKVLKKLVSEARKTAPTLIGKPAPDFTLFQEDGTPVALSEINEDFVVLFFWKPGCGHCEKAAPFLVEFQEKFKNESIKVLSICNSITDKYPKCWEAVKKKNLESLVNVGDQYQKSRILSKYYINSTPKVFVIDKNRKIVMKGIGTQQLIDVMPQLIKNMETEIK